MEVGDGSETMHFTILLIESNFRIVFWMVFGILIATGAFYLLFADGEVQAWNNPKCSKRDTDDNKSKVDTNISSTTNQYL